MSEEIKTLLIEAVNLLRRIAGPMPPAVPGVPPAEIPPAVPAIPGIPAPPIVVRPPVAPPEVPTLEVIVERFEEIVEVLGVPFQTNYITEKSISGHGTVSSGSPVDEDITKTLGRKARYGYIYSETGTITVNFNKGADIDVKASGRIDLVDLHLEVERLQIKTTSAAALTYRLLFI